ncbi:MAG TPA: GNAT family N-acetyltransferase, partial [Aggregatilineales bacterium]|nr:GNAT family N-acetyltransferase [Aggregatilineales bacterium]
REDLARAGIGQVGLVVINPWVTDFITRWGFRETNAVVTMQRRSGPIPAAPEPPLVLREVRSAGELAEIAWLDAQAFGPLWQYDRDTLAAARREAATFTRLERDGQLLGYELSTRHVGSAHLARLAVLPGEQGQGLGGLLVGHMLRFFEARGIHLITVNTQEDNIRSQRLYKRLGFEFTGHRAPVWEAEL